MSIHSHVSSFSFASLAALSFLTGGCDAGDSDLCDEAQEAELSQDLQAPAEGGLGSDIIRRTVRAHIDEVRHCYDEGLGRDPELAGRVVVHFKVAGDGNVAELPAIATSVGDVDVDQCIALAIQDWRFPKTRGGDTVLITYPFVLSPG